MTVSAAQRTARPRLDRRLAPLRDFTHSPLLLFYEVTQACDLVCVHCRACAIRSAHPAELRTSESLRLIDQVAEFPQPPRLILTGGDPLKRDDIFALIRHARRRRIDVSITPSATPLVTRRAIRRLRKAEIAQMAVSIDGPDVASHDRVRGVAGSFQRSLRILADARAAGISTQINTVLTPDNFDRIDEMADLFGRLGIAMWSVFFLVPVGRAAGAPRLSAEECEWAFGRMWRQSQRQPFALKTTEAPHYRRFALQQRVAALAPQGEGLALKRHATCGVNAGRGVMFVGHTGVIHPSGFLPIVCGIFPESHVVKVYHESPVFQGLRDADRLEGKCGVCEYRRVRRQPRPRLRRHGKPLCPGAGLRLRPQGLGWNGTSVGTDRRTMMREDRAMFRVAVIGGGISGLAAAHRLRELAPSIDVTLFEGSGRIGGVLRTVERDGFLLEEAADGFQAQLPWGVELCSRLGLGNELIGTIEEHRGLFVLRDGRLERVPDCLSMLSPPRLTPIAKARILSLRGRLRLLLEGFVPRRTDVADESIAEFAVRRFGREAYERIIEPLAACIYGADPAELSLHANLPRLAEMERVHGCVARGLRMSLANRRTCAGESAPAGTMTLRGGMGRLAEGIAQRLPPGTVHCHVPLQELAPLFAGGWRLRLGGDAPRVLEVDGVVLATPVHITACLLHDVDDFLAQRLSTIRLTGCAVVSLGYSREQVDLPAGGCGFIVPASERRCILSCGFTSRKYEGRAPADRVLLRVSLGGRCQGGLLGLPDDALGELAQREVASLLRIEGEPLFRHVTRYTRGLPQYRPGHPALVREIMSRLDRWPGLALAGNAYFGVGVPQCIRSGEQAAERIVTLLNPRWAAGQSSPLRTCSAASCTVEPECSTGGRIIQEWEIAAMTCRMRRSTITRATAGAVFPLMLLCGVLAGCGGSDEGWSPAVVLEARKEGAAVPSAATNVGGAAKDATQQTVVAASPASGLPPIPSMFSSDAERAQAKALYSRNCAACHGPDGGGDGIAAGFMFPKPRNFHRGLFRLVTTSNSVPTVEDLERMLARGMPGSAMPPWPNLSEAERLLLARQVIEFRREGVRAQEIADAEEGGFELDVADMRQLAEHLTTPGAAIDFPPIPAATAELIRQGGLLYQSAGCVGCHGETGKGDGLERMVDAEGFPTSPRDLTGGIFKGSTDPRSIYIRTQAGMPGAPMPATRTLSHEEISAVVHYVLSLSDEEQRQQAVLNSERIVAARMASLPDFPSDPAWDAVPASRIRLTPLWWRNEFAPHLDVQAVHDGRSIALRLTWDDATNDRIAMRTEAFADAVAVELHSGQSPPFLGMGDAENLVDVWFWNADREEGPRSIEAIYPDTVVDQYPFSEGLVAGPEFVRAATRIENQPDLSLPARASGNPIVPATRGQGGSTLAAGGLGSLTFRIPRNQAVTAHGEWREERWSVSMTRPLAVSSAGGVPLEPGGEASIAFAVWDGSQRDRNGQKSFTIWQVLELKP